MMDSDKLLLCGERHVVFMSINNYARSCHDRSIGLKTNLIWRLHDQIKAFQKSISDCVHESQIIKIDSWQNKSSRKANKVCNMVIFRS
jgi:hypothetical protein